MRVNVIFILVVVLMSAEDFNTGSGLLGNGHNELSNELEWEAYKTEFGLRTSFTAATDTRYCERMNTVCFKREGNTLDCKDAGTWEYLNLNMTVTSQYDYWEQNLAVTQVGKSTITVLYYIDETDRTSLEYGDQLKRTEERKKNEEMAFWILFFISFQTHHRFESTGHSTVRRDRVHRVVFDPQSESIGFYALYRTSISPLFMLGLKIVWRIRQTLLMLCNDIEKNPGPVDIHQLYDATWLQEEAALVKFQEMCDSVDNTELKTLLVTCIPEYKVTVLHAVAGSGHVKVLKYLLQLVPDLNQETCTECRDPSGYTPLYYAARADNTQCIKYLLECGADVNCRSNGGWTPLHYAAFWGQLSSVKVLVEGGADPEIRDSRGRTALDCAVEWGKSEIVSYLTTLVRLDNITNLSKMRSDIAGISEKKDEIPGPANVKLEGKPSDEGEAINELEDETTDKESPRTGKSTTESEETIGEHRKDYEQYSKLEDESIRNQSSKIGKSTTASEETTCTKGPRKKQPEREVELDTSNIERGVFSTTKKHFSIDLNLPGNYLVKKVIGQGGFGRVYLCIDKTTGRNYAVKNCFYETQSSETTKNLRSFQREIKILKELKHPNIVVYHSHYDEGGHFNILMEYVSGGSMRKYIIENGPLSMTYTIKCLGDILHGLSYLHQNDIIHRDLKSANALRTNEGTIKLADFGASKCLDALQSIAHTFIGTPYWMSPEVIDEEGAGYSEKIDIWGVGVIAFEFLIGRAPFEGLKRRAAENKILNNETKTICEEQLVSPIADHRLRDFTLSCVQFNPKDRPTAEEALKDPVFSGVV